MILWILLAVTTAAATFQERMDSAIRALVADGEPGIAVCAVADGAVVYSAARGLADLQTREPLSTATPVYVASVGKAFTTVAILRLVEQKQLALDDPIAKHIPALPAYMAPVTVRHLLSHTSGVPDYGDAVAEKPGLTNADVMSFLAQQAALEFPSGSRWSYSNAGFVLLAELFGRVSGRRLADYFAQEFFAPLQMTASFVQSAATRDRHRAVGYRKENDRWVKDDYTAYTVGPGGVYASAEDLCKWGMAFDAGRLLKRMTIAAAFTPHVQSGAVPTPMGLGFQVEDIPRGPLAGEWYAAVFGSRDGFRAVDMKLKGRAFRYVQLSNSGRSLEPMTVPNAFFER
jgi:CubicO group peptidase (beta-lactamase class C family)